MILGIPTVETDMSLSLKDIFDGESKDIKFDKALAKRIQRYSTDLMNRNEAHVMFFGSNLTGPYPLRFKTVDRNEWFMEIKDLDEFRIKNRILKESNINPNWVRATDAYNLDALYTMHRFLRSDMTDRDKFEAVKATAMALNIKLLGSIMAVYFKYDCDERVAQEVYARLSRKFYIKKYGNWRRVLEHRSEDITAKTSKWLPILTDFTDDEQIAQCISDIQGRLRSMIKYIWEVFDEVRADEAKFNRTSMVIETGGEKIVQDIKRDEDQYIRYAHKVALDRNTFIKPELIMIVSEEMRTMPEKLLHDVLTHLVNLSNSHKAVAEDLIETAINHAMQTIRSDRTAARNMHDLSWLLNKVKLLVMAPKTNDPLVFKIRGLSEEVVRESAKTKNNTLIASLKTGLLLYIVARTFAMRHYTN